jgi:hypothetical protein
MRKQRKKDELKKVEQKGKIDAEGGRTTTKRVHGD